MSGTSYKDGMTTTEIAPLQRAYPYMAYGPGKLTVSLALWSMCMLAAAPGNSILMQIKYRYDLHSCIQVQGGFFNFQLGQ